VTSALEGSHVAPLAIARNETNEEVELWEVVAHFATVAEAQAAARLFPGLENIAVAALPDTDWVRRSLEGLPPVVAGRFLIHGSHDRALRRPGGISLEIDAGTAFGTGHHPTTLGCLLVLDDLLKRRRPRRVLDVGAGSGILALAAAKALHAPVIAIDIDPEATRVARANAQLNGLGPFLRCLTASGLDHHRVRSGAPYDLIFANILARPLVHLAEPIVRVLARHGVLILSGFTIDQPSAVVAAYRNRGLARTRTIRLGTWSTLVLENTNTRSMTAPGVESIPIEFGLRC
jgi:ribosomal protein L11 methyltransferase